MTTTPLVAKAGRPAVSTRSLPETLRRALADPLAFGDHPDIPWRLPERLPEEAHIRAGIAMLSAMLQPVDPDHAKFIISKMAVGKPRYGEPLSPAASALRTTTWIEANGDLPNDLWTEAFFAVMRAPNIKRFPDTGEFRAFVADKLVERKKYLQRSQQMLAANQPKPPPPKPRYDPPREAVCRSCIVQYMRMGRIEKAQEYENELAQRESREPRKLERAPVTSPSAPVEAQLSVKIESSPASKVAMLLSRSRFWRAQGNEKLANDLAAQAEAIKTQLTGGSSDLRRVQPAGADHEHLA